MRIHSLVVACMISLALCHECRAEEVSFARIPITPRSRIDAIAYLGDGVVIAGTRDPHSGHIHKSKDYGVSWRRVGNVTGSDFITCLCSGRHGTDYLLTGNKVHFWKTTD